MAKYYAIHKRKKNKIPLTQQDFKTMQKKAVFTDNFTFHAEGDEHLALSADELIEKHNDTIDVSKPEEATPAKKPRKKKTDK